MPFFKTKASLLHCFVGLESTLRILSEILSLISGSLFAIFSANDSADLFVLTKTMACLSIDIVSREALTDASVVFSRIFSFVINFREFVVIYIVLFTGHAATGYLNNS